MTDSHARQIFNALHERQTEVEAFIRSLVEVESPSGDMEGSRGVVDEGGELRFHARTGDTFARWLTAQRVQRAQELLETTTHSIDDVAALSGFGTATSMRQHFVAALSTSPARYRREFARHA